jgi:hypothetical protein
VCVHPVSTACIFWFKYKKSSALVSGSEATYTPAPFQKRDSQKWSSCLYWLLLKIFIKYHLYHYQFPLKSKYTCQPDFSLGLHLLKHVNPLGFQYNFQLYQSRIWVIKPSLFKSSKGSSQFYHLYHHQFLYRYLSSPFFIWKQHLWHLDLQMEQNKLFFPLKYLTIYRCLISSNHL